MPVNFTQRSYEPELLDAPEIPKQLLFQNLRELDVINRLLGGHAISLAGIKKLLRDPSREYTLADIGCGGGDVLRYVARWARKNKFKIKLLGVDMNADAIEFMKEQCTAYPEITGVVSDYKDFLRKNSNVDIIHCSLFCHHLTDEELRELLIHSCNHALTGFIINDLHRHWFAYYSIRFLTRVLNGSSLVKNDAPLSVLRGFKKEEWKRLLEDTKTENAEVEWRWAFRHLVVKKCNAI